jgi:hypothetical protein
MGAAWAQHDMCESAFRKPLQTVWLNFETQANGRVD